MNEHAVYDVTIIGGGPAGLYSAFYSGLRGMTTKLIESQPHLGGKVNVYPEKIIWDVGGLPPLTGDQLIQNLMEQARIFDPEIVLNEKVTSIAKNEEGLFLLHTLSGTIHYSRTVILAIGGGILRPQKLAVEGADRFESANLHYSVKSMTRFKGKTVLISGGGNSAVDWANELSGIARSVYLIYRKETLKGHEASVAKLEQSGVISLTNTEIVGLIPTADGRAIGKVVLQNNEDGSRAELAVDEVIVNHGYDRDTDLIANSQVKIEMKNEYCIAVRPNGETSVPGLFAAGDIIAHEGKVYLIAGAFTDAANAVNRAKQYIIPNAEGYGMVSSHNERFDERNRDFKKRLFSVEMS